MDQVVPYVATPRTNYLDFLLIWHSRVLRKNSISKIHEITAVQKKKSWMGRNSTSKLLDTNIFQNQGNCD